MSIYLEDLREGQAFRSAGRTVTEADILAFAGLSGDFNELHVNEPWVREHTPFEGRIAHGLLVTSIASGLAAPGLDDLVVLAFLELQRRMTAPTYPGDTIWLHAVVESVRASRSRPGSGVAVLAVEVRNQRDEVVQEGRDVALVACRPAGESDEQETG